MDNLNTQRVITPIPARFNTSVIKNKSSNKVVAAYARVSTDKEQQEDSFERQVDYYTKYINSRADWDFGGIYADPGITGTRADKRPEFQRLMRDCRAGKINSVLVKSIARFARNTVDALNYIRELKEIGVSIYFETQNIDTMTPGGEVLLTILAAMAEQESRTISSNVKWAYQKKFQNGEIALNYTRFLGYTRDEKHNLVIVPEEAKIVERIYREYLIGYSMATIAKGLTEEGIPTPSKKKKWYPSVIKSILNNEKYHGVAILGKTYKPDVLSAKRYKNEGQHQKYYVKESHPEIISKEMYDMAQSEMKRRNDIRGCSNNKGRYSSKYPFSKIIVCGGCMNTYRRHAQYVKGKYKPTWVCANHKKNGNSACTYTYIPEEKIESAYLRALKSLIGEIDSLKQVLKENIMSSINDGLAEDYNQISTKIDKAQKEMFNLLKDKQSGLISEENYHVKGLKIEKKIDGLKKKESEIKERIDTSNVTKSRIEEITTYLSNADITDKFDGEMFKNLVESITVRNNNTLEFQFKAGIKITEEI